METRRPPPQAHPGSGSQAPARTWEVGPGGRHLGRFFSGGRKEAGRERGTDGRTGPREGHTASAPPPPPCRQGKLRLQKWYLATSDKDKKKMVRELMQVVLARKPKMCSFLEWRDLKVVYKRYASLYFCCAIEGQDNELITLELIHRYVELLDKYFGSVCELDIIFNFEKAYFILDEFLMGGEVQDTSKKSVLKAIEQADLLQEEDESPRSVLEEMGLA
nr:AP-1 complex subunit sigma-1A isoform X1 [Pogona vitticeps]